MARVTVERMEVRARGRLWLLSLVGVVLLGALPRWRDGLRDAGLPMRAPAPGLLLVARPGAVDRNFDGTVVLLLEVGTQGAWGLVLNRPRAPEGPPLPAGVDRWGGPVRPERRFTLTRVGSGEGLAGLRWEEGEGTPRGSTVLRFTGSAAWGPGQLERELRGGGWWLTQGDAARAFLLPGAQWAEFAAPFL
ncbi:YqgE/AlgH family protein [Corallococcus sp. M34]|uniref:YqgE/AlgH family protein n=1 Tax=Citreicoccus inhibens TaxID=2849499 RepID=UPI001C216A0C|nr:YqgE/AlgH family protein [Citreicoccus inhibens]MBU8895452.1 YqgE/AlgH family protein [Citreicoccus inhibens]